MNPTIIATVCIVSLAFAVYHLLGLIGRKQRKEYEKWRSKYPSASKSDRSDWIRLSQEELKSKN